MRAAGYLGACLLASYVAAAAAVGAPGAGLGGMPKAQPAAGKPARAGAEISFERDIRPILSENCFACHGPDPGQRQGGLRLDRRDDLFARRGAGAPVVPGKPGASRIWARVAAPRPAHRMPPPGSGKTLTAAQKDLLRRWIAGGAPWSQHWAFVPPRRPPLPPLRDGKWVRNPVDAFVLDRLEREGLRPSPEADRVTLLRRLALDLTGLPPAPAEVDAFLADRRPDAYERQVERLLASPHYGERWGQHWLDAARYADSDGFEKDKPREVWFYRDWVIHALNRDLPYNRFIIEQIAGDLLPNATQDQVVATGFLRNSMNNEEGGIDPEQFRMEAMFDRMDAIGKSVLGLTVQCAQCHTHKYDPITHDDYYRMFAFLNNCDEANAAVYTPEAEKRRAEIFRRAGEIEARLRHETPDWSERLAAWERRAREGQPEWKVVRPELDGSGGQKLIPQEDGSILAQGYSPTKESSELVFRVGPEPVTALRLELLNDPNLPRGGPGRSLYGLCALTEIRVEAAPADQPGKKQPVKLAAATADVNPPEQPLDPAFDDRSGRRRVTGPIAFAIDGKDETAWSPDIGPGRSNVPRKAVFVFTAPVRFPAGTVLTVRLDQRHGGWNNNANQSNNLGRYRLSVTGAASPEADPLPLAAREALAVPAERRSPAQVAALFGYWRTTVPAWEAANAEIETLWATHPRPANQLVLAERRQPRRTHRLERGDFLKPAAPVEPGVPAFLHPLPPGAPRDRLTFARWLVDPRSPTTARSLVNRVWQAYFGAGLVRTSEDLGSQSEAPSHPELLDWLAAAFSSPAAAPSRAGAAREARGLGWSLKALHRLLVTSSTYRQASRVTPALLARDPENRLLARGPRLRVEAEIVRDIALAASGLLNRKVGGPSVYPPAPEFLFLPPASYGPKTWETATGPDRHRRALYTFRYRSVPYPALQNFDAPNGDQACVRRTRSNTPLQALTLLNEPLFLECARALAAMTLREGGGTDVERLAFAFRRCTARKPSPREAEVLLDLLGRQRERFRDGAGAAALLAEAGKEMPGSVTPADAAAWTVVSRVLLNLDETITRE